MSAPGVGTPEPAGEDAPKKRLQLKLEMDAHSLDDLWHKLHRLANDLDHDGREVAHIVSGGGYHLDLTKESDLTEDEYAVALSEWWKRLREARAAAKAGSS